MARLPERLTSLVINTYKVLKIYIYTNMTIYKVYCKNKKKYFNNARDEKKP